MISMKEVSPLVQRSAPASALTLFAVLMGNMQVAQAACHSYVATPASGIIASGSTVTNNRVNTCFDDVTVPITNNGTINNNRRASLTNPGTLTNNALITNQVNATLNNSGTLSISAYGAMVNNYGKLSNSGVLVIDASSGGLNNNVGGTLINSGTMNINYGGLGNSGSFTNSATGKIINNAYLTNNNGAMFTNAGILEANSGDINNYGTLNNLAGATLINGANRYFFTIGTVNNSGTINNMGGAVFSTISGYAPINNNVGATINNSGSLQVATNSTLTNHGAINNTSKVTVAAGATLNGSGNISQSSGLYYDTRIRVDGVVTQSAISISGGYLEGVGSINGKVAINGVNAVLTPGNEDTPIGQLNINGSLDLVKGSLMTGIKGTDAGQFDVLNVSGPITLANGFTFGFSFSNALLPILKVGDSWEFLTGDTTGLSLTGVNFYTNTTGIAFTESIIAGGIVLTVQSVSGVPTQAPVPAAAWLFGSGLIGLVGVARGKTKTV